MGGAFDSYDKAGNLLQETTPMGSIVHAFDGKGKLSFNLNSNRLTHENDRLFQLSCDPLNRLLAASSVNINIRFSYDALGRRLSKTTFLNTPTGWQKDRENYLYHGNLEIGAFKSDETIIPLRKNKVVFERVKAPGFNRS